MLIKDIPTGFPRNLTFRITPEEIKSVARQSGPDDNIKIILSCTQEQKSSFSAEAVGKKIGRHVTMVYDMPKENHSRSPEIAKMQSPKEKLAEYMRINGMEDDKSLYPLLKELDESLAIEYTFPCHMFRLVKLELRGAIGFKEGIGKDNFEVDFTSFVPGIVALCGDCGRGKCVTGETLILSKKGFETIGSYDNKIRGFQNFNKELLSANDVFAESSHFYSEEVNETIKITNSLGMEIEGTPEHPVLIFTPNCTFEFKKLKDISCDDYVCVSRNMNVFPEKSYNFDFSPFMWRSTNKVNLPTKMSIQLAKFLGYYIANGSHTGNSIQFSTKNKKIADDYIKTVKSLFNINISNPTNLQKASNLRIFSSVIRQFLEYIFNGTLTTARYKIIPNCILQGTKEEQVSFLTALFDCDGCLCNDYFEFSTASKQIANSIQNMLLNFGIISTHGLKKVKPYDWIYHKIVVRSLNVENLIYLINKSLKYNYKRTKEVNPNKDIIPYINPYIRKKMAVLHNGYFHSENGKIYITPLRSQLFQKGYNISYKKLELLKSLSDNSEIPEVKELNSLFKLILSKNYFFSKITKKEVFNDKKIVYDFSIPSTHQFYSSGYISHNTTLIENCHPYLRMLTRSGKLQSHFFLKDSYRKLTFQDEEGTYYLVDIQIDGKNKSGKVHAFAYTGKSLNDLKPVPGLNGNVDPYEKWCAETFGSIDIFLKTAFFTKGNTGSIPDLSSATKGEKRTLFNSLLGFEKLSGISAAAREKRKQYEQETKDAKLAVEDRDFDEETRTVEKELDATASRLEAIKKEISDNEKKLASMEAEGKTIDYRSRVAEAETELEKLRMLHNHYAEAAEVMAEWEDKKDFYEAYLVAKNRYEELVSAMTGAREELSSKEKSLDKIEKEIRESEFRTKSIQTVIDERTKNLPDEIDESCPTCGQRLPPSKIEELRADLEKRRAEIEERKNELAAAMEETVSLETSKGMYAETEVIPARERLSRLEDEQAELAEKLHDSESLEKLKMKAESYGDYKEADLQNVQKKIDEYETRLESDRKKLAEEPDCTDTADSLKKKTESLRDEMTSLSMKQGELTNEITNIKKAQKRSEDAKKLAGELARKASSYEMLEKAFGPDGIQALELEAAAPEIADITNGILHRAYGDKFRIQFQTLRVGASNNLIEDFNITITNVETGTSKPLEWLSGGEGTWIKEALFHAFSIIRAKKQKSGFLTRFLDEADGSLDPDSRLKFLQLIKAVHEEENSELTVLITHSTELKDLIEQKIEL